MKSITNISIIRHFRTSCKALPEIFPFRRENRSSFRHSAEKHSGAKGKHIAAVPRPRYPLKTSGATSKWPFRATTPSICIWRCSGFSKRCFSSRWRSFSTRWKWRNTSAVLRDSESPVNHEDSAEHGRIGNPETVPQDSAGPSESGGFLTAAKDGMAAR